MAEQTKKLLRIKQSVAAEIKSQAAREAPLESCGYLAARDGEIPKLFPMSNADKSTEHFSFDPKEQFQTLKRARAEGLRLVAVYHSHPASPPRLSEEDLRLANDPEIVYLIYSIIEDRCAAFMVDEGKQIHSVAIEVTP